MSNNRGFITIEMTLAMAITAFIGLAAAGAIFQAYHTTATSDRLAALRQVQNAGYWMAADAQMAETITIDGLPPSTFMRIEWAERGLDGNTTYNSVTYSFEGLSGGIGKLKRSHWSSGGINSNMMIAERISYTPGMPAGSSQVSFLSGVVSLKITSTYNSAIETRSFTIYRRNNL